MTLLLTKPGIDVFAGTNADGSTRPPVPADAQGWATEIENYVGLLNAAGAAVVYDTVAELNLDLAHAAGAWGLVTDDGPYSGYYVKSGGSGAGLWSLKLPLSYSFVNAIDAGAGTANAIEVTARFPVFDGIVVAFALFRNTTSSPVTVSIPGLPALTLKTNRGNNASGLTAEMEIWGRVRLEDNTFRLLNDQDVSALVGQAETAQALAEAARDEALSAVPNVFPLTSAALKALDTSVITSAFLKQDRIAGQFKFVASDLSGILSPVSFITEAISGNVVTKADHGLTQNQAVYATTSVNGLTANTIMYVIGQWASCIYYNTETAAFTAGQTLTGGTSGATATIDKVIDNGTIGIVLISGITGTFASGETITDGLGGSAKATAGVETIRDPDRFELASSFANAAAGTAFTLTGTTAFTLKTHIDPREIAYVIPDGKAFDGSEGAWVRLHNGRMATDFAATTRDGSADDTEKLQAIVHYVTASRLATLYLSAGGTHKTTSSIFMARPIEFYGTGIDSDYGDVYAAAYFDQTNGFYHSTIRATGDFSAIVMLGAGSYNLHDFNIQYPSSTPAAGRIGIQSYTPLDGPGLRDINVYSRITRVSVNRAYYGLFLRDCYDFVVGDCVINGCEGRGIVLVNRVMSSVSDGQISGCSIHNNKLGAILITSSGGVRIMFNKLNYGDVSSSVAIEYNANLNEAGQIEPILISANSIEGQNQGIVIRRSAGIFTVSQVNISANQVWTGGACIVIVVDGTSQWVNTVNISTNTVTTAVTGAICINVDGVQFGLISSNQCAAGAGGGTTVVVGAHTTKVKAVNNNGTDNCVPPTVTTPTVPVTDVSGTNTYPHPIDVYTYGGTGTATKLNGATINNTCNGYLRLEPGDSYSFTYSTAPTMYWKAASA